MHMRNYAEYNLVWGLGRDFYPLTAGMGWNLAQLSQGERRGTPGLQSIARLTHRDRQSLTCTPMGNLESRIILTSMFVIVNSII